MTSSLRLPASGGRTDHFVLSGALVVDGTGAAPRPGWVEVRNGRIIRVHERPPSTDVGVARIDVSGYAVAPGFIDVHSHADNAPLLAAGDADKILQGVTTEVVGNCGFSLAPAGGEHATERFTDRLFPPLDHTWGSFGELFATTDAAGYVTNYAPLVGHGALRAAAGGSSPARTDELTARMRSALDEALEAGVLGLSTGLTYPPGAYASSDEVRDLVELLPPDAVYATHMRNEGAHIEASIRESLAAVAGATCRVHISHLKLAGRRNWGRASSALGLLASARERGVRVTQDAYPYIAGSTTLTACLPPWAHEGGDRALMRRLTDPSTSKTIAQAVEDLTDDSWENHVSSAGYDGVLISSTTDGQFEGMTVEQVADQLGCGPFEALRRILVQNELKATMVLFSMCDADVDAILADSHTMVGSDGLPPGLGGRPHPRQFGTFPRVLGEYTRDRGLLSLAEAVRKMTGFPASIFSLAGRGLIEEGAVADLVVFDPETVRDRGTFEEPTQHPLGIHLVFVGGTLVVEDGRWNGTRAGKRLTR